jgi:hypothetical protein
LVTACGVFSAAVGLVYILNLPRLTADATSAALLWGLIGLACGVVLVVWARLEGRLDSKRWVLLVSVSLGTTLVIQLPPAALWFAFTGEIVGDSPFGGPVGHWAWSLPHIFLAMAVAYAMLLAGRARGSI